MPRNLPKHVYRKPWGVYFAKGGRKPYFRWKGEVDTPEFWEWYARCQKGEGVVPRPDTPTPPDPVHSQTFRWLCVRYYNSVEFKKRDKALLDTCCGEPIKSSKPKGETYADLPLEEVSLLHLKVLRDRKTKANLPEAANGRVKALRRLCKWAVGEDLLPTNPALELSKVKGHADKGFKLWTPKDIEAFEERHPIGTKARLAFDIFRYLGCARVDAVKIGWPMVESVGGKRIVHFNRSKTDVEANPLLADGLVSTINATPKVGIRTWLVTEYGKPFSPTGFGNWFRDRCIEARILDPKKRAHAIRHSAATIDAENGATAHQLMAKYGWRTLAMAQKYCDRADRRRLAASMGAR